uniref:Ras family GTPase n=1 Tax=Pithovirus LCPAC401 TaxID=2506595 RepID=A0A481Z9R6_9VIRU|nr:MAG: Ras family GTPase [Pithovirus LCPAC401]
MRLKVCLVGPAKSGKTHFVNALLGKNIFGYVSTSGVVIDKTTFSRIDLELWDIGFKEGINHIMDAHGVIQFGNDPLYKVNLNVPIVSVLDYQEDEEFDILRSLIELMLRKE